VHIFFGTRNKNQTMTTPDTCRFARSNYPDLRTCVGRYPPGPPYELIPNAPLSCKQVTGPGGFPFIRCDNYVPQFESTPQSPVGSSPTYGTQPLSTNASVLFKKKKILQSPAKSATARTAKEERTRAKKDDSTYLSIIVGASLVAVLAAGAYYVIQRRRGVVAPYHFI